ncbi:MAG: zf-HC2 domain-containing protein, partial [Vulcanimicrobiaceae bacterium]
TGSCMRCNTSEALFDGRLEGTLTWLQRTRLDAHLERCGRCSAVLEELRVIDALLLTPRALEPAPNFTFKAMAEIRTLPQPQRVRAQWPWMFGLYLALSWLSIGAWFAIGRPDGHAAVVIAGDSLQHVVAAAAGFTRALGSTIVAEIVALMLVADAGLLFGILYLHARFTRRVNA